MEVAVNLGNLQNIMSCGLLNHKMRMYPSSPFTFRNIPSVATGGYSNEHYRCFA